MRVLMICDKFTRDEANGWLTNDLVAALDAAGHTVDVIHHDWVGNGAPSRAAIYRHATVVTLSAGNAVRRLPVALRKIAKWLLSSYISIRQVKRMLPPLPYDLLLGFSPAIIHDGIMRSYAKHCRKRYLILWDFFPKYHRELGVFRANKAMNAIAKWLEARAIKRFDAVGLMSPANVDYFRAYHPNYSGICEVFSLWGPATLVDITQREAARAQWSIAPETVACIFGGQLIAGRGIEHIFTLAHHVRERLPQVVFIIAGGGPLHTTIQAQLEAGDLTNTRLLGQLTRPDYLRLLSAGDIGLVFNSGHVSVPTYPSKTIDYFRAALPILGIVEKASDYSHIITHEVQAGYSTDPENMAWLEQKLVELATSAELRDACGKRGQDYFLAHMTAASVCAQLEGFAA